MKKYQMQIEMDGLITVLAENLYADPNVFVREMIQNGHDGIAKRLNGLAEGQHASFTPEIRILQDAEAGTLTFCDNGAGLTQDEIHRYLSTIGGSDKRKLKDQTDHQSMCNMIGQFGIGMLSSFIVADRVEVLTRSESEPAFLWRNQGGASYTLEEAEKDEVGTHVTLYLKSGQQRFLDATALAGFVRTYADIIGIPIYLNREISTINRVDAPWHLKAVSAQQSYQAHAAFWAAHFPNETAISTLPIDCTFTYSEAGKQREGVVKGALAVTSASFSGVDAQALANLYVSRMFIGADMATLLPAWANFMRGVIESPSLRPNAARDNIMPDAALAALKEALGKEILQWLQSLAQKEPAILRHIMRQHTPRILAMIIQPENRAFFLSVADMLPLESNYGATTMADYLKQTEPDEQGIRDVYFFPDTASSTQSFMLAEAKKVQAINAGYHLIEEFLHLYESTFPGNIRLHKITADSQRIFEQVDNKQRQQFEHLRKTCDRLFEVQTVICRFNPADIPFLLSESDQSQSQQEIEDLSDNPAISGYLRDIMDKFVSSQCVLPVLHLNVDHALIRKLETLIHTSKPVAEQALMLLYNNSVLLFSRRIRPKQVKTVFEQVNQTMQTLLDAAELIEQQHEQIAQLQNQLHAHDGESGHAADRKLM